MPIKSTINIKPVILAVTPLLIESSPRDAPTVLFSATVTGAGSEPAFKTIARLFASLKVKLPEILASPPEITVCIVGAE